ncbi:hypothetical protein N431DRAFT_401543 [Stipitochalara longipes BDJ]|nr:hypothetical protein N431DRAFT_401543 [Stipitochalara longipes BDJ]
MLSTIGRAAVRRLLGRGHQSTNSALRSLWHLQYVGTFQDPKRISALPKSYVSLGRCYATATKAASKPRAATTKTAKPKKKAVARKAVKKPIKKVAKKKVVKKLKPKPKGRPRKILSAEEAKKDAVKAQKAKALSLPKNLPQTAWTVLASEWAKAHPSQPATGTSPLTAAAAKYKSLSPAELEHYNHLANQNKTANAIAYKQWVESYTPEQIRVANNARAQLRTKDPLHTWKPIHDDRNPKRPSSPLIFFAKEKYASGDLKGITLGDNARLVAREWAALSPSDRKAYENLALADKQRYAQEFKTVFHRDPDFIAKQKAA